MNLIDSIQEKTVFNHKVALDHEFYPLSLFCFILLSLNFARHGQLQFHVCISRHLSCMKNLSIFRNNRTTKV